MHTGDADALRALHEENKECLKADAKAIREKAQQLEQEGVSQGMPTTNKEWLDWLGENEATFQDLMGTATKQRRSLSQRLVPQVGGLPEAQLFGPKVRVEMPAWTQKLRQAGSGFVALKLGPFVADKMVAFSSSCTDEVWVALLVGESRFTHILDLRIYFHELARLAHDWARELMLTNVDVEVFWLDAKVASMINSRCS